jgi:DNA-binding NarL/FixJ family response regulator
MAEGPPTEPLRVVIADDHPFYRMGLARSLRASGIEVVAEAPNGEAAVRAVEQTSPDVVVMDLKMPGLSGIEATRRLTRRTPASRVLVLSVSAEESDVTDAILAGATSYMLKDRPVQEVIAGIRAAAAGEFHVSPQIAIPLLRRLHEPAGVRSYLAGVRLSSQEAALFDLLADGRSENEIAEMLGISLGCLRSDASNILGKLRLESRLQAALLAYRRGEGRS